MPGPPLRHCVRVIRWARLTLAALAASTLTVLAQAPADAGAPDLPRPANGADAIRLLGDDLVAAAEANGLSSAELRRILREDPTAWLDRDARMYYVEPTDAGAPDLVEGVAPFPLDQTFLLHSRPTSTHVIYLDFDGTTVSGTAWNTGLPNGFYSGYSLDGDLSTFNDNEKEQVQSVWQRVAEDYAAFDVDVTTQDPGEAAIDRTNAADQNYGTRAAISDNSTVSSAVCPSGLRRRGVRRRVQRLRVRHVRARLPPAGVGVPDTAWPTTTPRTSPRRPATRWATTSGSATTGTPRPPRAAATSTTTADTRCGRRSWASATTKPVVQWSKGEYTNANNTAGRPDGHRQRRRPGASPTRPATRVATAAAGLPVRAYITSAADTDTFALGTCAGTLTVSAAGAPPSQDLDLQLELLDASGSVVDTANPASAVVNRDSATGLNASLTAGVASGAYYARVDGVGNGTGTTGYTDYASIGAYTLTVSGCNGLAAPAAPAGLAVSTNQTGTSATVTWTTPVSDGGSSVTGYTASRSGAAPESLSPATFTKTWSGLTPGASYLFSVAATNAIGTGVAASQNVTMPNPTAPAAPQALSVVADSVAQTAHVTWNAPASDGGLPISSYDVLVDGAVSASGTSRDLTLPGFARGSTHTVSVRAVNPIGAGTAATATVTVATTPGAPGIGKATKGKKGGKKTATVAWTAPATDGSSPITGYTVLIYKATGRLVRTVTGLVSSTHVVHREAQAGEVPVRGHRAQRSRRRTAEPAVQAGQGQVAAERQFSAARSWPRRQRMPASRKPSRSPSKTALGLPTS